MGKRYVNRKQIVRRFEWKRFQVILTFHHGNIDRWRGTCRVVSENWGELSQNSLWRWVNWTNDTALESKLSGQSIDKRIHAIFCTFFSSSFTECSSMECGNITPREQSRNRMFVRECIEAFCPLRKVSIGIPLRMRAPKGCFTQQI